MNRKTASMIFLGICVVLAVLLLLDVITPIVSGSIFAVALVIFGSISRGFTKSDKKDRSEET